jgi:PAS domain S-box-containing protein/diguanylate cyclase (GGDEF)-like protein
MEPQDLARQLAETRAAFAELQADENEHLGSLIEIQRAVAASDLDVESVMRLICERTQKLTRAEGATILIIEDDHFVIRVATGFLEGLVGSRVPITDSQPGWMHRHNESGILGDAQTDVRAGRLARETGMRSGVAVQLRHRKKKIGQLIVVSRQPNSFTEDDVATLQRLSAALSAMLSHAAEFETKGQQVESLARFETIYRSAAIGITLVGPDGRYIDANPAYQRMTGYTSEELALMTPLDHTHPASIPLVQEALGELGAGTRDAVNIETRFFRKDGKLVWGHVTATLQLDADGHPQFSISLIEDITERKEAEEKLTYLAYNDELTGLANRAGFMEKLDASIARAGTLGFAVGVINLDLDSFSLVNDSLGYSAGDELLALVAARLRALIPETSMVAREGGDQFLLLMSDLGGGPAGPADMEASVLAVDAVARRVHELLKEPFTVEGVDFIVTGSIGIGMFPRDASDGRTLVGQAEVAMFRSKALGPGGTVVFTKDEEDPMRRLRQVTELRRAVERQSWVLHYQPIVDLGDGHVDSVEALIRGRTENGDLISPDNFIPLAEDIGVIGDIGDWVVGDMCRQMREWNDAGLSPTVGFNLAPRQLLSAHFAENLVHTIESAGVDPRHVVIEITESATLTDAKQTRETLQTLHDAGFRIAIDDFGTGYSSLGRLKHLPIDILKIDRSFVRDAHLDRDAGIMVQTMVQLAKNLGMQPLAEGVETTEELAFLRALDCPLAQGFLFSRPVPASEITELLTRRVRLITPPAAA